MHWKERAPSFGRDYTTAYQWLTGDLHKELVAVATVHRKPGTSWVLPYREMVNCATPALVFLETQEQKVRNESRGRFVSTWPCLHAGHLHYLQFDPSKVVKKYFKSLKLHSTFHCDSQYARHALSTLFAPYCVAAATDSMPLCCSAALVYVCPCPLVTSSRWSAEARNMCSTRGEEGNNPLLISGGPGWLLGLRQTPVCFRNRVYTKLCTDRTTATGLQQNSWDAICCHWLSSLLQADLLMSTLSILVKLILLQISNTKNIQSMICNLKIV